MTPASFIKTMESYVVSLGTISRQTSYDCGILRQAYEIIRVLPIGSPSEWYIYLNGPKRAGLITASDQIVLAVQSCNSWLLKFIVLI